MTCSPKCITAKLTDAEIRRQSENPLCRELKDPRYPVLLRYHKARDRASYIYVGHHNGQPRWRKLATWPVTPADAFFKELPRLIASVVATPDAHEKISEWATFGQMLRWYLERVKGDRRLSKSRRDGITSQIRRQLLPIWGDLPLALSRRAIDETVMGWQASYQLETVRGGYSLLRSVIKLAMTLTLLDADPLLGLRFCEIVPTRSRITAGRLRPSHAPAVLATLPAANVPPRVLCLLMLLHGTRIGETRRAAWRDFDLVGEGASWHIPGSTTKNGFDHTLPLTPVAVELLASYRRWQQANGYQGVYLFPHGSGQLSAREATRWVAGVSDRQWRAHDLRKLARTRWTEQRTDYHIGEALLNHSPGKLAKTYVQSDLLDLMRAALVTYHDWLATRATGINGINVISFEYQNNIKVVDG